MNLNTTVVDSCDDAPARADLSESTELMPEAPRGLEAIAEAYGLLDPSKVALEEIEALTSSCAELFAAPVAQIAFVNESRAWTRSSHGSPLERAPRHRSLCGALLEGERDEEALIHVASLKRDPRTSHLDLPERFESCLGAPLRTPGGVAFGALIVIFDRRIERVEESTGTLLEALRRKAEVMLERRHTLLQVSVQQRHIEALLSEQERLLGDVALKTRNLLAGILCSCEYARAQFDRAGDERDVASREEGREALLEAIEAAHEAKIVLVESLERRRAHVRAQRVQAACQASGLTQGASSSH